MKILIVGIDGYLGWPLAQYLTERGHEVGGIDAYFRREQVKEIGSQSAIPIASPNERKQAYKEKYDKEIYWKDCDVTDWATLLNIFKEFQPESIVHLGENPSAPYSMASREKAVFTQHNNVIGNLNLLFAMRKHCPSSHLIKLGTLGEYGTPNIDIEEGWLEIEHNGRKDKVLYPKKPGSFYHLSKVHDSHNIEFACRIWGTRCTDLNQGLVYGLKTEEIDYDYENLATSFHYDSIFGTVINRFITQTALGKPMTIYGSGSQKRGFLNISDTIKCIDLALNKPPKAGEFRVFNQFTDFLSLIDMSNRIKSFAKENNIKAEIVNVENPRIEDENHYYNPKNISLLSLGLKPIEFDNKQIENIFKIVKANLDRINQDTLEPNIKWKY